MLNRSLRLTSLALTVGLFAWPAAQADVLLSNLNESNEAGIAVGIPADSPNLDYSQAIRFQTGSSERGYNLTSVKVVLANASDSDGVRVRIFGARSIGTPYISFYTLENPVIADGTMTFTAPASATLRKNAGYFVVFDSTASGAGNESNLMDCPFRGWGLHNCHHSEDVGVSCGAASSTSLASTTLSGSTLELRFDRALDSGSVPFPGDFVVEAGPSSIPVASVAVVGNGALLELSRPAGESEKLTLSYLPGAMHPLRDTSFNPVPAFSGQAVRYIQAMATQSDDSTINVAAHGIGSWDPRGKVEILDLSASSLDDLHELSVLTDLEMLKLDGNRVSDLSPLSAIIGLEELDLSGNAVSGLSSLGALTDLRVLDLSDNQVSDLTPLASLTRLRRLDLSRNLIADLSPLSELRGLEVLLLDGNRISNLAPLWNLSQLAQLSLRDNGVADASMLREMHSLRRLHLSGNRLRDIWVFGDLPALVFLGLSGNPVTDFSPLGRLKHLRWLMLNQGTSAAQAAATWPGGSQARFLLIDVAKPIAPHHR